MAPGEKSWITYAGDDKEALKAIILVRSLKRVLTRMPSIVFVAHTVSDDLVSLLEDEFERCISMTKAKCGKLEGMEFGAIALLHSWALTHLKTFVFLDCNSLVVKNGDELFREVGTRFQPNGTRVPMVVDHPCKAVFKKMISEVATGGWTLQDLMRHLPTLEEKYNVRVDLNGSPLIRDINDMKILQFDNPHPIEVFMNNPDLQYELTNDGSFERKANSLALELFTADGLSETFSAHFKMEYSTMKNYIPSSEKPTDPSMEPKFPRNLQDAIAIVGMSFRLPGANNIDEFWDLLIKGKDGIIKVPDGRWSDEECIGKTDSCKEDEAGFLKCPVDQMDTKFFGLSPAELAYMDPQQRLTLQVTWEALEHSGINPQSLKNTATGVFGGWWRNDYTQWLDNSSGEDFLRVYMATALGSLAGRISHMLDTTGPCIATESGCSTSIVGVDMACKNLRSETCDLGLAFGVNLLFRNSCIKTMHSVVAPDGHCKTFDAKADGFGRAEGCTVLVLKRYPDAIRDGDRIWGLIRGSAMAQEGPSRSLGTPTVQCEALAMKLALEDAGVEPNEVSFVETHGTGTPVGDPIEVAAMTEIYSKDRNDILTIGSVKTNIGHTESCAGIAGIIKTILSLKNEVIPPHRNFETLNPEINLDFLPARIPLAPFPWKRNLNGVPRIAGVSSFGITGTDAHVIIQEAPDMLPASGLQLTSSQPMNVLKLSAKSDESLEDLIKLYIKFLGETQEDLEDICYTANTGRADFQHRVTVITSDKSDLIHKLSKHEKKSIPSGSPKICFLFTGQGSQYPGMTKSLYEYCPTFKMHFDSCDILLQNEIGINIKDALWGDKKSDLGRTIYSQTSIFCVEYCLLKVWESWGVTPDIVLGHSLGEFAAAVAAGMLEFKDALKLVAERSRLIDDLPQGKMLVIKDNLKNVDTLLQMAFNGTENWLDIAAINSPDQTVLAGSEENIRVFSEFCKNNRLKTHILDATHAFHSRHMDPMLNEYTEIASKIKYMPPTCTFISGMEGQQVNEIDAEYWVQHTRKGVQFIEACKSVLTECHSGAPLFLEIGPNPVLSALTMNNSDRPLSCLPSLRKNTDDWSTLLTTLGKLYLHGFNINWANFHQYSTRKKVTLPFYPFQNKPYWYEPKDQIQNPIHPLIGTPLSSPSSQKVFQNSLELNKALLYMKDHEIGNKIIFPMAGFLEMCLVAGHSAIQCEDGEYFMPNTPITVQNFQIEASLGLIDTMKTQLQTIVSSEDAGETRVTIYSKIVLDKKTHKWVRHAAGAFLPYAVKLDGNEMEKIENLEVIKSRCKIRCTGDIYAKFRVHGLKLGPLFQTSIDRRIGDKGEICNRIIMTEKSEVYILHPIIIDAMIQAIVFADNQDPTCLSVPVSVSKFIWFARLETEVCYVYVNHNQGNRGTQRTVVLYDNHGQVIAQMVGLTLIDTTIGTIMSTLEAQKTSLPNMYQDVWREGLGPLERRVISSLSICDDSIFSDRFKKATEHFNFLEGNDKKFYDKSNQLCILYIINGLYELGWSSVVGQRLKLKDLMQTLNVLSKHEGIFRYILTELAGEGYLKIMDLFITEFEVVKLFPSKQQVMSTTALLLSYLESDNYRETHSVASTGKILSSILNGKTNALPILFPEDSNAIGPAEAYYIESLPSRCSKKLASHLFANKLFLNYSKNENKEVCRILEVGAGTGSFTKALIPNLKGPKSSYEYTYTDISPAFFLKGEKIFQDSGINVIYKTLNLELDPLTQGFIPHHYDVIYAAYVVHATKDTRESISHLRNLLRPGGLLILVETVKPHLGINLIFGMLEGYWRFTDTDLRPFNCEMPTEKWHQVLRELKFCKTASYDVCEGLGSLIFAQASHDSEYLFYSDVKLDPKLKTWILFDENDEFSNLLASNLENMGRRIVRIKRSSNAFKKASNANFQIRPNVSVDMDEVFKTVAKEECQLEGVVYSWALNYKEEEYSLICQPYLHLCQNIVTLNKIKLVAYTKGLISIGDHELSQPMSSLILGMTKTLSNESQNNTCKCVVLDINETSIERMVQEAVAELFLDDFEVQVAYRNNTRYVCRLNPYKLQTNSLPSTRSDRFHLILPSSNAISDLKFSPMEITHLGDMDVEIRVKAYGLNFRDIFAVVKPDKQFDELNSVGIDFAGVVSQVGCGVINRQVGDLVFGMNLNGNALPSFIKLNTDLILPIPNNMTFNEAATLPTVAATASVCLLQVAKLKVNETVLIHTGSGGVGLSAIQIAKSLNCDIITTAGSSRKRAYLRNLGITHVFNSRNTDFEKNILIALGGAKVDVVLNSLTSPGFKEASLSVCKIGARFIEMSKLNTWTTTEVKSLRPDVFYDIVDLSSASEPRVKVFLERITKLLTESAFKPLPYVAFDAFDIREALTYLQKAKHIGKVVCVMSEPSAQNTSVLRMPLFNDRSTYLITGGLGGIGLEVAKWMTSSGAKYIVLAGRSVPRPSVTQAIRKLNLEGSEIISIQLDVGNYENCQRGLETLKSMGIPPLRGIMHAAGVLSDATFVNQTWKKYETVFNAKVKGGWNLHKLTLEYPLEHFIMFSSATAKLGPIGLGNHSSANVYLDTLTTYRNSIGLPATTINWGQWGQVGVAANIEMTGLKPFTVLQGISALERVMKTQQLQTIVLEADLRVLKEFFPSCRKYLEELKYEEEDTKVFKMAVGSEEFWAEYDSVSDKFDTARKYTDLMIRPILKMDEPIGDHTNFQEMGLDSLMMIELKNSLQTLLGDRAQVSMNSVKDCNTLTQLATRIVELATGIEDAAPPTKDTLSKLIRQDSQLPLHISPEGFASEASEIRTVLITGVSGNLGPYILREISKRPQIQKIYCLMRPTTKVSGQDRLYKILSVRKLDSDIRLDIVECVAGTITESKLGLADAEFTKLSQEVDAVFHLAVKSDHLDTYRIARGSKTDVRTVNVFGTINVLEFACSNKPKHVYHASTLAAVSRLDGDQTVSEDWPLIEDIDGMPNFGYPISKFVGDLLMAQAVERGLPCKVFRIPNIGGDSIRGGNVSVLDNLLMLRFMAYLHLGIVPTATWTYPLMLIPVDICAELSCQIFFEHEARSEVYNVFNPHSNNEEDFVDIASDFGYLVTVVEPKIFVRRIMEVEDSELLYTLKRSSEDAASRKYLKENVGWMSNPQGVFWSKKLLKLIPKYAERMETSLEILRRDLQLAKASGIFKKLGLK